MILIYVYNYYSKLYSNYHVHREEQILCQQKQQDILFNPKPMDLKDHWSILSEYSFDPETDLLCSIIYDGINGQIQEKNIVSNKTLQQVLHITQYVVYIPTDLLLELAYKKVKCLLVTNDEVGGTLTQAQNLLNIEQDTDRQPNIQGLSYAHKLMLNDQLGKCLKENIPTALPNENLKDYLKQRAQRDHVHSSYWKTQTKLKIKLDKKKLEDHRSYLMEQKWGKELPSTMKKDFKKWRDELEDGMHKHGHKFGPLIDKINDVILQDSRFNATVWGRQLGHFYRVEVDLENERTSCNCELYNFIGSCIHTRVIELVEFNKIPPLEYMDTSGKSWCTIRSHYHKSLVSSIFNSESKNVLERTTSLHYLTCYPQLDPNNITSE